MSASRIAGRGGDLLARYSTDYRRLLEQKLSGDELRQESEQRAAAQEAMEHLRTHDSLTDLPNRTLFDTGFKRDMSGTEAGKVDPGERAKQNTGKDSGVAESPQIALYHIDLNDFRDVNNAVGYAKGDLLLVEVAHRLVQAIETAYGIARLGSDEYAISQRLSEGRASTQLQIDRLVECFSRPFILDDAEIMLTASIGISFFPSDSQDLDQLHRFAKLAASSCKEIGRTTYQSYDPLLQEEAEGSFLLESSVREALANGEMSMVYQPQFHLETGELTGVEALIRWNHPQGGIVYPDHFIPAAERSGLINEIGEWTLRAACRQAVAWDADGLPPMNMGVNVSAAQLRTTDIPGLVKQVLTETGLDPDRLELEITETVVMRDLEAAASVLAALRELGVKLAIDDFGIGYSALSYLRRLPVDKIKLDRSFIVDVTQNEDAAAVASTIVTLAHNLRLCVTAEGVETEADAQFLREIGCTYGQGYYYGRPASAEDLTKRFAPR